MGRDGEDDSQQRDQQACQDHADDGTDDQAQAADGGGFGKQETAQVTQVGTQGAPYAPAVP